MRNAIRTKYSLIRYYYTELSMLPKEGGAFYKPVFFEFPDDDKAYDNQHHGAMLGKALKLSVLSDVLNQNSTDFYFPAGTWCEIHMIGLGE